MDFDAEKLIFEVENRPSLWNTTLESYSDKILRIKLWKEITDVFGRKEMSQDEKKNLGLSLQKKWKNLRDSFVKEFRKMNSLKSGSGGARRKPTYMYFNHLMFLKDIIMKNKRDGSLLSTAAEGQQQDTEEEMTEGLYDIEKSPRQKRRKLNPTERKRNIGAELVGVLKGSLSRNDDDDPDRHFLLSLLNDFKRIPENLKATTKIRIMALIMDASQLDLPSQN